jgi:hypothetical protein
MECSTCNMKDLWNANELCSIVDIVCNVNVKICRCAGCIL